MKVFLFLPMVFFFSSGAPQTGKLMSFQRSTALSRGGGRIVGGMDANPGEFPHQTMILQGGVSGSFMCGGSLVSDKWVVTAGHCCDQRSASDLAVAVGSYNLNSIDVDQENIGVKTIINHNKYDPWTIENDICLLQLETAVTFGTHVATINLPEDKEEYNTTLCTVVGWGATIDGGNMARVLQKVDVPVMPDKECRMYYGQNDIKDSMICAGYKNGGKDSCQGDSGGPLMCGKQLSGIVSWGYGCALPNSPGVYTQTSYFIDWLSTNMEES